jgi:hypothetical protein
MFIYRVRIRIRLFFGLPDPNLDTFVRGMDPRIQIRVRIRTKMSRIRNELVFNRNSGSLLMYLLF